MPLVAHKYMPHEMAASELQATFAAREHTLQYLLNALRGQSASKSLTSYLITGPRGAGKTTLVLMLRLRLRDDPALSKAWLPVLFPEECPAITSLRDLLVTALRILADDGHPEAAEWLEKAEQESDDERSQDLAVAGLQWIANEQNRRVILLIENLDMIFERGLDSRTQATLRRLLMTDPFLMIIGTAVHVFEALKSYDEAFFNYFCPVPLERLDDRQVRELMSRRAKYDQNDRFPEQYRRQRSGIRAITRLTGGNPRLILMLYEVLSGGQVQPVVQTLRQLVDELTPLLKDVLESLPPQQSKVLDALMRSGGIATPRQLATATRLDLNKVTTQLQRLKESQIIEVRGGGKGRTAYYTVPDQLFCTWYQLRYLRPNRRRIEMFVELLKTWFDAEERLAALQSLSQPAAEPEGPQLRHTAEAAEYYAASLISTVHEQTAQDLAVGQWLKCGELREASLALADFRGLAENDLSVNEAAAYGELGSWGLKHDDLGTGFQALREALQRDPNDARARVNYGVALLRAGDDRAAFECFEQVTRSETASPALKAAAICNRGAIRLRSGDIETAMRDWTEVIQLQGAPAELVGTSLMLRAGHYREREDTQSAIRDCTAVIELAGTPTELLAFAYIRRGLIVEDLKAAIRDFSAAIKLSSEPRALTCNLRTPRSNPLWLRACAYAMDGQTAAAIHDLSRIIDSPGSSPDAIWQCQMLRASCLRTEGNTDAAIRDYTAAIDMPGAGASQVAQALVSRGLCYGIRGESEAATSDFTAVLGLKGIESRLVADATFLRGLSYGQREDYERAIGDFSAVIESQNSPINVVAIAHVARGESYILQGAFQAAVCDFSSVIESRPPAANLLGRALLGRGISFGSLRRTEDAIGDLTTVINTQNPSTTLVRKARLYRGWNYSQVGKSEAAIRDLVDVVKHRGTTEGTGFLPLLAQVGTHPFRKDGAGVWDFFGRLPETSQDAWSDRVEAVRILVWMSVQTRNTRRRNQVLKRFVSDLAELDWEQRAPQIIALLRGLVHPGMKEDWGEIVEALTADQPQQVIQQLIPFRVVADVLRDGDPARVDALPPEQCEFAAEVLEQFDAAGDEKQPPKPPSLSEVSGGA